MLRRRRHAALTTTICFVTWIVACDIFGPDIVTLIGTVRLEGEPVEGWEVRAERLVFGEYTTQMVVARATTNADGDYAIDVEPCGGVFLLVASRPPNDLGHVIPIAPPTGSYRKEEVCSQLDRYDFELGREAP